jgi:hypothetical protein
MDIGPSTSLSSAHPSRLIPLLLTFEMLCTGSQADERLSVGMQVTG